MNGEKKFFTNFSLFFTKKFRITIILFLASLVGAYFTYTKLLKREGFPSVSVPVVIVQTEYFAGDERKVDSEITKPIEDVLKSLDEVKKISSTTTEFFSAIVVELYPEISSKDGLSLIQDRVEKNINLPQSSNISFKSINASSVDGENDLVFTISGSSNLKFLQNKASEIAEHIEKLPNISKVSIKNLVEEKKNLLTGDVFDYQKSFNRVGVRKNGNVEFSEAVAIGVIKRGEIGSIELSQEVRKEIDSLKKSGKLDGLEIEYGGDFAESLEKQISSLEENFLSGLIVVFLVLFFLVNLRSAIVTTIFIPVSLGITFIIFYIFGYTLNTITLFSLILLLGLFVDDAIVVVEAIDYVKKQGEQGLKAIKKAIDAVGTADFLGTATTLLVFVPMFFISGILGDFIKYVPITVTIGLSISLIVSLSLMPFFANLIISGEEKLPKTKFGKFLSIISNGLTPVVNFFAEKISKFIKWYLSKPIWTIFIVFMTFFLIGFGGMFAKDLKFSVFPPSKDSDNMIINISFPERAYSVQQAEEITKEIESIVSKKIGKYIESVDYFGANESLAKMRIGLVSYKDREKTSSEMVSEINKTFENFKKAKIRADVVSAGPQQSEYQFFMQIYGTDKAKMIFAGQEIEKFLKTLRIDKKLSVKETRIVNIYTITKNDGREFIELQAKTIDPDDTSLTLKIQKEVEKKFSEKELQSFGLEKDALGFDFGQESKNLESFESMIVAFVVAVIVMYILLVFQFNSFLQPMLIFLAIPFSFPGLFPALVITENPMSFFVMLGMISLVGIVVNNTIMFIDFANQAREDGEGIIEASVGAIRVRFRPLITTTMTTVAGLLPLAISDPFWEALSFTIIFGLVSSTIFVILVFPAFYAIGEKIRGALKKVIKKISKI